MTLIISGLLLGSLALIPVMAVVEGVVTGHGRVVKASSAAAGVFLLVAMVGIIGRVRDARNARSVFVRPGKIALLLATGALLLVASSITLPASYRLDADELLPLMPVGLFVAAALCLYRGTCERIKPREDDPPTTRPVGHSPPVDGDPPPDQNPHPPAPAHRLPPRPDQPGRPPDYPRKR